MVAVPIAPVRRSLAPKEHGAYGELAFPLLTSLLLGPPTVAAVSLTLAAVALFVAHEPLLVVLGHRGARARTEDGPRAMRMIGVLAAIAAVGGSVGLWLGGRTVALTLALPIALVAVLGPFVRAKKERTAVGELVAAAALAAAAVPVAVAASVPVVLALSAWGVWTLSLSFATVAVRTVIARSRKDAVAPSALFTLGTAAAMIGAALLAFARLVPAFVAVGLAPLGAFAVGLFLFPPPPKRLRRVGWLLIGASLITAVTMALAMRAILPR